MQRHTHTVMRGALISLVEKPLCGVVTIKSSRDRLALGYKVLYIHDRTLGTFGRRNAAAANRGRVHSTWAHRQWTLLQQCLLVTHSESTLARGLPLFSFFSFFFSRPTNQTASCTTTGALLLLLFNGQLGAGGPASEAGSSARLGLGSHTQLPGLTSDQTILDCTISQMPTDRHSHEQESTSSVAEQPLRHFGSDLRYLAKKTKKNTPRHLPHLIS